MKILVIGGTRFVGRHFVEIAVKKGHQITLFNRGKSNPGIFSGIEQYHGSRNTELSNLLISNRHWDCVLDTCGYVPRIVKSSAEYLKISVDRYVFVSTISVYADFTKPGITEDSPLSTTNDPAAETVTNENYGPLKVLCEKAVNDLYGDNTLIIRPGLIVGPYDPTDRFTYWPVRISRGGEVIAPSPPDSPVQFIDGRDLAEFMLSGIENKTKGTYNATGPEYPMTMEEALRACIAATGSKATFAWVSEKFIEDNNIDMPGWVPKNWYGISQVDCSKAIKQGLRFRSLHDIIKDTLDWHATRPADYVLKAGLKPEVEVELLEKWRKLVS
ncbi:MAG TPA: SDR family oxidoreductase [bacterium]